MGKAAPLLASLVVAAAGAAAAGSGPKPSAATRPAGKDGGFVRIFDGRTLNGWHAVPPDCAGDWSVRDGVLVGVGSRRRLAYLAWRQADLADFELRLRYRLPGRGNTGIELRARPDPTGRRPFVGYHADLGHVGIGPHILGAWDFHFARRKEPPCPRGTRLVIDPDGRARAEKIPRALTRAQLRPHEWNDVRVVARGRTFRFYINGVLSAEFTDNAARGRLERGTIALQIHDRGMRVEFRDILLKRLPPAATAASAPVARPARAVE